MKKVYSLFILVIFIFTFAKIAEAKRYPIVVPTAKSYTLVREAYSRQLNGAYSIHPPIIPIINTIIHIPAWNGVFWFYKYTVYNRY